MNLVFEPLAFEHLQHWVKENPRIARRIMELIEDALRDPYKGKGKPEPLKHNFSGLWSRRINDEHRLLYKVDGDDLHIIKCRYHY